MPRIALGIEYNGASYSGWQRQSHTNSIQATLEQALSQVADTRIEVFCAGRTDRGVHATGQVIHFDYSEDKFRKLDAWLLGGNSLLPQDVTINWAQQVSENFHARHSAIYRRYQYYIYINRTIRALLVNKALWSRDDLNILAMQEACQYLIGEQDFSSLRSSRCDARTPYRNILAADIKIINNFIVLDIKANAFLHHMVRNIVGCLLEIGSNKQPPDWLADIIKLKDRTKAARTAPPVGLYLIEVGYPKLFSLEPKIFLPFAV
jgi:tRNA pseudouridine38-40 synthase